MKLKLLAICFSLIFVGCAGRHDFSRVEVSFKSSGPEIDILGISGLDMGPMYSPASYTPRYVGDKGYMSHDEVKLDDELVIRWRLSEGDQTKVFRQVVKRPLKIPKIIPRSCDVIFMYSGGNWTILLEPLPEHVQ